MARASVRRAAAFCAALCAVAVPLRGQQRAEQLRGDSAAWLHIARVEDARAASPAALAELRSALRAPSPQLRAQAARAIGRLERADAGLELASLLQDDDALVRGAAAQAIAQSVHGAIDAPAHLAVLQNAWRAQPQDRVLLAEPLGRVAPASVEAARTIMAALAQQLGGDAESELAALRGLYFAGFSLKHAGQPSRRAAYDSTVIAAVRRVAAAPQPARARQRSLALILLSALGAADPAVVRAALEDTTPLVRRDAVAATGSMPDSASARALQQRALADAAPLVRYEALRVHVRRFAAAGGCAAAVTAAADSAVHVATLAADLLGGACRTAAGAGAVLDSLAAALPAESESWHVPAHALVALARVDSARAHARLPRFAAHGNHFVRAYAARAAGALRDEAALRVLASDADANVRTAAVTELSRVASDVDDVYIEQLRRTDSELLIAAAAALEKSRHPAAVPALLDALDRVTALQQETSRDPRLALLDRLEELGGPVHTRRLEPLLSDFDSAVAARAADVIAAWSPSGERPAARPVPAPPLPFPSFAELAALERARALLELEDGRSIELQLMPFDAPTNAARFARLAERGYYDGLTFHRVVPNFVLQGGSPGANEYSGDGPFTRDEVGLSNWRGTVGLSTRGRDTGDAQFYVNQVHNVRLDHEYTIFAAVVAGMEVVDTLQEGARIRRVRIR